MMKLGRIVLAACLAAALSVASFAAYAALPEGSSNTTSNTSTPKPESTPKTSISMTKSVKAISALLSEKSPEKQIKLFSSLIKNRLTYTTARSLCGREGDWLAFVDLYQDYANGKALGCRLQQATVQYGLNKLPDNVQSVSLSIGKAESDLEYSKQFVFRFSEFDLGKDALTGDVQAVVNFKGNSLKVLLEQEYPGTAPDIDKALAAITPAYIAFAQKETPLPVDHTFLRLRSYVRNMSTFERAYVWELYLVHGVDLPAQTTILRWDVSSNTTSVCVRELTDYI